MTKVAFFDRRLLATFYKYATAVSVFLSFVFPFVDIPKDCLPAPSYGLWYKEALNNSFFPSARVPRTSSAVRAEVLGHLEGHGSPARHTAE
ncbi:MAG: hypothetical protein ACK5PF_10520, partial [bacterium]